MTRAGFHILVELSTTLLQATYISVTLRSTVNILELEMFFAVEKICVQFRTLTLTKITFAFITFVWTVFVARTRFDGVLIIRTTPVDTIGITLAMIRTLFSY